MIRRELSGRATLCIIIITALLTGCQLFSGGVGQTVDPERRLPLKEGGPHTDAWVTRDLVFSYEYVRQGGRMTLDGSVEFRGAVSGFPVMQSFYLRGYYLNAEGQIIAVQRIYSSAQGKETESLRFRRELQLPPEASGWAIGYSGRAMDYGQARDTVDWSFWDTPFN